MNLEEFVKETLVQIARGVLEAGEALSNDGGVKINPQHVRLELGRDTGRYGSLDPTQTSGPAVQLVEFDVAVFASRAKGHSAGLNLSVASIGISAERKSDIGAQSESRVKFAVPIVLPFSR